MLETLINVHNFNGLVQDSSNSIANSLELLQSCTKPSIWDIEAWHTWVIISYSTWVGATEVPSINFHKQNFSILQKYQLDSFNHIYIWQVSLQLSCNDTCQV